LPAHLPHRRRWCQPHPSHAVGNVATTLTHAAPAFVQSFGVMNDPTLVLLHPLPLDGTIWSEDIRSLASKVVAPTLYGLGSSMEEWAAGVLALCADEPLILVGNSVGGSCAVEVASLAPERVRLLVLVGAKAGHRPDPAFRDGALQTLDHDGFDHGWVTYWEPLFGPAANPDLLATAKSLAKSQPIDAITNGVRVFHSRPDRSAFIRSLDIPIIVVSGKHDTAPSVASSIELASSLRRGEFNQVDESGHYVPLEAPIRLAEIVRAAMDQLPPA
jgi:pimeloyl-ACP methyl ester carboxylesterase